MSVELKIKSKHLALEPAIIRFEEEKLRKQIDWFKRTHQVKNFWENNDLWALHSKWTRLYDHRKNDVANEARATYLARAYLKGIPYNVVEKKRHEELKFKQLIIPRIAAMITKYGTSKPKMVKGQDNKWIKDPQFTIDLIEEIKEWAKL